METSRTSILKGTSKKIIINGELLKNIVSIPDVFKRGKVEIKMASSKKSKKPSSKKILSKKYVEKLLKEVDEQDVAVYTLEEIRALR